MDIYNEMAKNLPKESINKFQISKACRDRVKLFAETMMYPEDEDLEKMVRDILDYQEDTGLEEQVQQLLETYANLYYRKVRNAKIGIIRW